MNSPIDYQKARRHLMRRDPVLGALIKRCGPCGLTAAQRNGHFEALVRAIVHQQLSTGAAATIFGRFAALFPGRRFPTPAEVAPVPDTALRAAGFSVQKIGYLRDLCAKASDGTLALDRVHELEDEDVIRVMTQVKGIGRWSAEMFLIFRLHRPDVLPAGDLGIVRAIQKAYRLRKPPSATRIQRMGDPWRPYRSVASWYLWASLRVK